ncbi:MAG: S9 family peptidase [Scytolyngbya sp. HA4215-MV1]|jgi:dipeptidyl aminopeptidase/acylaminoacyl peptidase|nr:S9 family peptidase [Scytolyngbya sp. HA4215-MV1]
MTLSFAQNATIVPNENLVAEGIPPIPAELSSTVQRYTEFRAAVFSSWHPVKREMLISTRFADTPQVHRVKVPLGMRQQLTFFPERVSGATYQPTQGDYFVFSKDTGGNEFSQNYRYDLATGDVTLLTDGKSKNSRGIWSNRGDRMVYTSTRRTGQDNDLYIIDPTHPKSDRLLAQLQGGGWSPNDWSPDDRQLLVGEFVSINESYLWLMDVDSGEKKLITPKGEAEKVAYPAAVFSKDGKGLYALTDRGSEFARLVYIDLATQQHTDLSSQIPWDVEDFDLSEDGKLLAFVTNEDGISILHLLDTATREEIPLPKLPTGLIGGIAWHRNSRDLAITFVAARSTADVYAINVITNTLERWTESETGGLNTSNFAEPELVRWQSFDGKTISGFLYRPPAKFTGKRPVMIDIHGGPEGQSRPVFLGRNNFYLNELGVAILLPNVRGSSGYGKNFLKLDNGFLREDSVKDIGALLDWIKARPDLDSDRILVTGGSYGGYMSLAVATHYSDRIRASIDIVGISNFVSFLERTEGYRRDLRRVEYGDERDPKMRAFLEKISPLNNAHKIQKPLFVIHGKNDPRVPLNEAEQIIATVRKSDTPVWYLMAKDEGHGFGKKKNVDFQFYATVMFIKEYLLK